MAEHTPYRAELVTPDGVAFAGDVQIAILPGAAGELGILANHAPLVSTLDPGVVSLTDADGATHRFATDEGYVQVRRSRALVLVGEAVAAERIDASEARSRLDRAREALEQAEAGAGDVHAARREAGFAKALVKTAGR